ncbi:ABC transporter substrate-binding protein [Bdellovibrionota bacterium FG-2]
MLFSWVKGAGNKSNRMRFCSGMCLVAFSAILLIVLNVSTTTTSNAQPTQEHQIRVDQKPSLPLDPMKIQTMADYDLQLCLYRTWFEYDLSRKAKSGIVSEWSFDSKRGRYRFTVADDSRWSDGSQILPEHLIENLTRAVTLKTSYGEAIRGLIKIESAKVLDKSSFELETRNHQPSEKFFQRMGSSFLAPVHPDDWDNNFQIKSNRLTSGPYRLVSSDDKELKLEVNLNDKISLKTRPPTVTIRFQPNTDLSLFIDGKTWANVMQTATLMPIQLAEKVKSRNLPYWTRGYDRVSRLMPLGTGKEVETRRRIALAFGTVWADFNVQALPFNSRKAFSLQPPGYPLLTELDFRSALKDKTENLKKSVKIVALTSPQNDFQAPIIVSAFQVLGVQVDWLWVSSFKEMIDAAKKNPELDFQLGSFGVADPEPTTWMGLILTENSPFAEVTASDLVTFKKIAGLSSKEEEVKRFQGLLREMGLRGSYVPLFHFSTLSLGQSGISFENVQELDETVDYSKLILK